jgi:hypothetical protein
MSPPTPPHYVQRSQEFEAVLRQLIDGDRADPVAITTALTGAGGFGKTSLAAAICHDERVLNAFDDGILWVTLGEHPDLIVHLKHWSIS